MHWTATGLHPGVSQGLILNRRRPIPSKTLRHTADDVTVELSQLDWW